MTSLVVIGLAIALNVSVLVGGVIWLRRQMTRVAAERAARAHDAGQEAARVT